MNKGEFAEKYVNELAYSSYLKYWCYPNPIDEEGDKKEICDLLILFRNTCIIISVKNYEFNGNYQRYTKKVVEKSTKQLYGAERKLFGLARTIKIKHPEKKVEEFNPEDYDEIFRITINAGEQFEYYSLADQKEGKGFINIFNKKTFEHIIAELDTIPDLIELLRERERLLTENKEVYLEGQESDLLAVFMLNRRAFPEKYIGDHEILKLDLEGAWESYDKKNVHVKDRRAADKQSYLIDNLVKHDILKLEWGEKLAKELMHLSRMKRRIVAQNLFELVEKHKNTPGALARRHVPDEENDILFLFIYYPPEEKQEMVDKALNDAGLIYMYKTDFKYKKIIALASTKDYREYKFGLVYQEDEMSQEAKDYLDDLCNKFGWFQKMEKKEVEYKEFPNEKDDIKIKENNIKKRQEFYWLGRKHEKKGNYIEAIKAYKIYSTYLADRDKHIPHQWISNFYEKLGENEKSLVHLEKYAKGCSPPRASEVFKEIGEKFLGFNAIEKAVENFEKAIANDPNIGVKKKLDELKNSMK